MEQELYDRLMKENDAIQMVRPYVIDKQWHRDQWKEKDITVLICQRQTPDLTRLALESLLQFYPDIPILVVDGNSGDESALYLAYMAAKNPNITIWTRDGRNSHGDTMHDAFTHHIKTKYVMLMDSDIIVERGGFIEGMLQQFKDNPNLYATGTLMIVTRLNDAVGVPYDETDVLRYAHPSLSILHLPTYHKLGKAAWDHGSPLVYTMQEAEKQGLDIGAYPLDKYVCHLSGGSWTEPYRTIWDNDHGTTIHPMLTFILNGSALTTVTDLQHQSDKDFDIIPVGNLIETKTIFHDDLVNRDISGYIFSTRFKITGDWVCSFDDKSSPVSNNFVATVRKMATEDYKRDWFTVEGITIYKRQYWQRHRSIL